MAARLYRLFLSLFLFSFPWQTVWILRERFFDGVKLQYETLGLYATEGFLWLAVFSFLCWWYGEWKKRPLPFSWTPDRVFVLSALTFIAYAYCSSLWAPDPLIARQHAFWILEAYLFFFLLLLGPLPKEQAWFWFSMGSIAPAVLGIYQFLTQTIVASSLLGVAAHPAWEAGTSIIDAGTFGRWLRAYGPFPHPNLFGGYLVVAIIALDSLVHMDDRRYTIRDTKPISSLFSLISLLQWSALFFTFSRSAWLAVGVWVLLTIVYGQRTMVKTQWLTLLTLLTLLTTIYYPLVQTRLFGTTPPETRSFTERTSGYREALALWQRKPLTGVGIGNYTVAARNLFPHRAPWEYQPAHNVPLLLLAELGILGLSLLALAIIALTRLSLIPYSFFLLLPLLLFDHYLWSSHAGLLLLPFFFVPILSTPHPQQPV